MDVTVVLDTQPTDNVTVDITENDTTDDISLSTTSLTFGDTTWNDAQTVTITATDDSLDEIDESYTITFNPSGGDYESLVNKTSLQRSLTMTLRA